MSPMDSLPRLTHPLMRPSTSATPFPQGQEFQLASYMYPSSPLSSMPASAANVLHVNAFSIDYRPDGSVAQFYSDLSLTDPRDGRELLRKTISVNDPFRYGVSLHHAHGSPEQHTWQTQPHLPRGAQGYGSCLIEHRRMARTITFTCAHVPYAGHHAVPDGLVAVRRDVAGAG